MTTFRGMLPAFNLMNLMNTRTTARLSEATTMPLSDLRPHPLHTEIYGDGADDALVSSVKDNPLSSPECR